MNNLAWPKNGGEDRLHYVGDATSGFSVPAVLSATAKRAVNPNARIGIGGAPTRATTLPTVAAERKKFPVASGFMDYFPDAIVAIANLSWKGNQQHNPDQPLHWARGKSGDESDTMMRHFLQRGTIDDDGIRHSVKMAWRALAIVQKELEEEQRLGETGAPTI